MRKAPFLILAVVSLAMANCSGDEVSAPTSSESNEPSAKPGSKDASSSTISPNLRAAYVESVQRHAPPIYAARAPIAGLAQFENPEQRFSATLDRGGVVVRSDHEPWLLSMQTTAIGCEGALGSVADAEPEVKGNEVRYRRNGLEEWYLNGPLGVEQGFVLTKSPQCTGLKVVQLGIDGDLVPTLQDTDGDGRAESGRFVDAHGRQALSYTDLFVKDATGKQLPAWLSTQEGELAIVVDDAGAEYPVEIDPLVATEIELFTANNGGGADAFGVSVSVSGDTALVGAMYDDVGSNVDQGAAYVFVRSGGSWVQQARLVAGDGKAGDWAGRCVSLSGDTAIVGADYHISTGNVGQGAAYIFVRNGTTWTQQQKLEVNEGGALAQFGFSVAIDGNTAIIGARAANMGPKVAQGAAYVFVRDGSVWQLQKKLLADDGGQVDRFGVSVDVQGDTAIVGANQDDIGGHSDQGSAYIFTRTGITWGQQAHLIASDGSAGDTFGSSVKLSGDTAIVGSRYHNIGGNADQGAAYVFTRNVNTWSQQTKLTADDGAAADGFGVFVTIDGDVALVGAAEDNVGSNADQGSVYVFNRQGSNWLQQTHKWANGGVAGDWFGFWCALSDDTFLVGAPFDTAPGAAKKGTVYAYKLEANLDNTCTMSNECLSGFCVDGVCCDTACSDTCQACTAVKKGQGTDGVCGPIALYGDPDNECPVGSCSGLGTCQSLNGVACSSPTTCLSGNCADGVCCGNACAGPCRACTVAKRGSGYDGQCGPIAAGTDPEDECPSAECNGAGACQLPRGLALGTACSENTQCVSGFCADGFCCNSACTGTCEACSSAKKTYGSDGECEPIAATKNPDGECSGGYCNGSGACVYFNGVACASASECISTYCVDDVCCGNACTDSCMACTVAKRGGGYDGQCGFIATYTDPDDECPSAECNGSGACQLP